ncbi:unnamed protein product [Gadus morhua 'NCC']
MDSVPCTKLPVASKFVFGNPWAKLRFQVSGGPDGTAEIIDRVDFSETRVKSRVSQEVETGAPSHGEEQLLSACWEDPLGKA